MVQATVMNWKAQQIIWEKEGVRHIPLSKSKRRFRPRTLTVQVPGSSNEIMSSKHRPEVGQYHGWAGGWRPEPRRKAGKDMQIYPAFHFGMGGSGG